MGISLKSLSLLCMAALLSACGGSSSNNDDNGGGNGGGETPPETAFTDTATWTLVPESGESYCYDFDVPGEVDCADSSTWDLKFQMGSRTPALYTNSGSSGSGNGGALGGPFDYSWESLQAFTGGLTDGHGETLPSQAYLADALENAFTGSNSIGSQFFEYGISGHLMFPNYRVFLITTDNTQGYTPDSVDTYAVQIIGYYGGSSGTASGYPSVRWAKVGEAEGTERTEVINAANYEWVYFDLENGVVVDSPSDSNWHLAFNRYNVKTNSGVSGGGKVGSFVAATPDGFYDSEGNIIAASFQSETAAEDTLPLLFAADDWSTPANANAWKKDAIKSSLNPVYQQEVFEMGSPMRMQLNYGWYRYYSGIEGYLNHSLAALPENGVMLRSAEGESYARVHLTDIEYADPESATSQTTWTFEFEIAP